MSQRQSGTRLVASPKQPRVVIPVRVSGKKFAFKFGDRMPDLVDGASAEVVVDPDAVEDKYLLSLLQSEQTIDLLAPEKTVLISVRPGRIPDDVRRRAYDRDKRLRESGGHYVEVVLIQPLRLRLSGAKRAAFGGGGCTIPALDDRAAISLNQAFTFISEVFEPRRQSHVGNAFLSGLFYNDDAQSWSRLEDLRIAYERRFQEYITEQCGVTDKRQRLAGPPTFEEWLVGQRRQTTFEF